jgi:hypothetical protein
MQEEENDILTSYYQQNTVMENQSNANPNDI